MGVVLRWGTETVKSNIKDLELFDCNWFESLKPMELNLPDNDYQWPDLFV